MTFTECVKFCAGNAEMVRQFDRLRGTNLSLRGSALDLAVDEATGRLRHDLALWVAFVYDAVWLRLPPDLFEATEEPDPLLAALVVESDECPA